MFVNLFKKKERREEKLTGKGKINNELFFEILKDNTCLIIDKKSDKAISKLKLENEILSIKCLENKDLIFEQKNKILIYRIIENKYCFLQAINIGKENYYDQEIITFLVAQVMINTKKDMNFIKFI